MRQVRSGLIIPPIWHILGFVMQDDQFTKLFAYMQDEFGKLRNELTSVDTKVDRVYDLLG